MYSKVASFELSCFFIMAECDIKPNPTENSEDYMGQIKIKQPNLMLIPNYGKFYWEFSHPEEPLDLNTLPGYLNIEYDTDGTQYTSCDDANEICCTEIKKEALDLEILSLMDVVGPTPCNNAFPAYIDADISRIDRDLFHTEITTSNTNWHNTNQLLKSLRREVGTTKTKVLRNHPFLTPDNLRSIATKRLDEFNLKPGHIIKFVYYGLGILHPTFSPNVFLNKYSYTCLDCSETFNWKCEFQWHSLVHSGGYKSILCSSCPKDFWYMHELIRHSRIHNNCRPFECGICGNGFKHRESLIVHLINIHKLEVSKSERLQKDYICPECYVVCDTSTIFEIHMKDVHQAEESFEIKI